MQKKIDLFGIIGVFYYLCDAYKNILNTKSISL